MKNLHLLSDENISNFQTTGFIRLVLPESLKIKIINFRLEVIDYLEAMSGIKSNEFSLKLFSINLNIMVNQ